MKKYLNVTNKTVILSDGTKVPPGYNIILPPEIAAQAGSSLKLVQAYMPDATPRQQQQQQQAGLSDEDKEKLDRVSALLEQFPQLLETLTSQLANQKVVYAGHYPAEETAKQKRRDIDVPVILDDANDAIESNINDSTHDKEEESTSLKEKLKKLRELKGD